MDSRSSWTAEFGDGSATFSLLKMGNHFNSALNFLLYEKTGLIEKISERLDDCGQLDVKYYRSLPGCVKDDIITDGHNPMCYFSPNTVAEDDNFGMFLN